MNAGLRARDHARVYLDLALAFDPRLKRCDLVFAGGTLALDATPVTPMLAALGSERRASPDNALPDATTEGSLASGLNPRRGWVGDALNAERLGSRLWLLERSKLSDDVLLAAEDYALQALQPLADAHGTTLEVAASRVTGTPAGRNAMLLDVQLGAERRQFRLAAA